MVNYMLCMFCHNKEQKAEHRQQSTPDHSFVRRPVLCQPESCDSGPEVVRLGPVESFFWPSIGTSRIALSSDSQVHACHAAFQNETLVLFRWQNVGGKVIRKIKGMLIPQNKVVIATQRKRMGGLGQGVLEAFKILVLLFLNLGVGTWVFVVGF